MKKTWRRYILPALVGVISSLVFYGFLIVLVGSIQFAKAVVMDGFPTPLEKVAMVFAMLMVCIIAALVAGGEKDGK